LHNIGIKGDGKKPPHLMPGVAAALRASPTAKLSLRSFQLFAGAHVTSPASNTSGVQQACAYAQLH